MKAICYYRVSTVSQKSSGLGLEAQRETVRRHLGDTTPLAAYTETESGKRNDRPELAKALDHCKRTGASLVIAKLDRLSRNARFILALLDSGVDLIFCDLPQVSGPTGRFLLTSMAAVAQLEGELISQRTREALAAAKRRGVKLGGPNGAAPLRKYIAEFGNGKAVRGNREGGIRRAEPWRTVFAELAADGLSLNAMARTLNARGERTVRGGTWTAKAVSRIQAKLAAVSPAPARQGCYG